MEIRTSDSNILIDPHTKGLIYITIVYFQFMNICFILILVLGGSSFYGSIINPGLSLGEVDLNNAGPGYFKVYKRRWYLLLAFSFLSFTQGGLGNVWTVTAHAAEAAFGWSVSQVSTMQAWMYIMYLVAIFPFAWLMDTRGKYKLLPYIPVYNAMFFLSYSCHKKTPCIIHRSM